MKTFSQTPRSPMRNRLLDAAYQLVTEEGWDRLRISRIAALAGVRAVTVHQYFLSLEEVHEDLMARETELFVLGIVAELDKWPGNLRKATQRGVHFALCQAAENPLVHNLLTPIPENAVKDGRLANSAVETVFASAHELLAAYVDAHWPAVPQGTRELMSDVLVRLTLSQVLVPGGPPAAVADDIAEVAVRIVGPGSHPGVE